MAGDGAADDLPTAVADDDEDIEQAEGRGGDRGEVHGGEAVAVVAQEGGPGLASGSGRSREVAQEARHGPLGDCEAEAKQLAVDAWRAPGGLRRHSTDEVENLTRQGRAPGGPAPAGEPGPVGSEAGAVPADDGTGLDNGERACPAGPRAAQDDPESAVGGPNAWSPLCSEGGQLLAQGEVLEKKITARAHGRSDGRREGYQQAKHEAAENRGAASNRQWFCVGRGCGEAHCKALVGVVGPAGSTRPPPPRGLHERGRLTRTRAPRTRRRRR